MTILPLHFTIRCQLKLLKRIVNLICIEKLHFRNVVVCVYGCVRFSVCMLRRCSYCACLSIEPCSISNKLFLIVARCTEGAGCEISSEKSTPACMQLKCCNVFVYSCQHYICTAYVHHNFAHQYLVDSGFFHWKVNENF